MTSSIGSKMAELSFSFPSSEVFEGALAPWNQLELLRMLCNEGWSHGERATAQFLLSVWNPGTDWVEMAREHGIEDPEHAGRFDLHDALGVWDDEHRAAFLAWVKAPWWP